MDMPEFVEVLKSGPDGGSREAWEAAQPPAVKHFPDAVRMLRYFVDLGEGMPEKQREAQALLAAIDAEKAASR